MPLYPGELFHEQGPLSQVSRDKYDFKLKGLDLLDL